MRSYRTYLDQVFKLVAILDGLSIVEWDDSFIL